MDLINTIHIDEKPYETSERTNKPITPHIMPAISTDKVESLLCIILVLFEFIYNLR